MNHIETQYPDFENLNGTTGEITQDDIDHGVRCDHEACALTQALWRIFPGCVIFIDDYVEVTSKLNQSYVELGISDELLQWIDRFDNKKPIKPVELIIKSYDKCPNIDWILKIKGEINL